jgi:hypothetical protein
MQNYMAVHIYPFDNVSIHACLLFNTHYLFTKAY